MRRYFILIPGCCDPMHPVVVWGASMRDALAYASREVYGLGSVPPRSVAIAVSQPTNGH